MVKDLIHRNVEFLKRFNEKLIEDEEFRKRLPADFRLLHLPLNDPELMKYNLRLESKYKDKSKPLVVAYSTDAGIEARVEWDTVLN